MLSPSPTPEDRFCFSYRIAMHARLGVHRLNRAAVGRQVLGVGGEQPPRKATLPEVCYPPVLVSGCYWRRIM